MLKIILGGAPPLPPIPTPLIMYATYPTKIVKMSRRGGGDGGSDGDGDEDWRK